MYYFINCLPKVKHCLLYIVSVSDCFTDAYGKKCKLGFHLNFIDFIQLLRHTFSNIANKCRVALSVAPAIFFSLPRLLTIVIISTFCVQSYFYGDFTS